MWMVTEDGLFAVPLFHGTSDFFGALIMKGGLGTNNIVESWRLIDLAKEVCALLHDRKIRASMGQESALAVDMLETVSRQEVTGGGMNFRHGMGYLSAAKFVACNYAKFSKGSEMLTTIYDGLAVLPDTLHDTATKILDNYPEARTALDATHVPIIVTARDVPIASVREERGDDLLDTISSIEKLAIQVGRFDDSVLQSLNVELVEPVPADQLSIEQAEID
jgi:hypothetical protein